MVNIKISRFSRAKKNETTINDNDNNNIKPIETIEPIKNIEQIETIEPIKPVKNNEPIEIVEPLTYDNLEGDNFLDDLNNMNYKPDVAPIKEPKIKTKDKPFDLTNIINKNKKEITQSSHLV